MCLLDTLKQLNHPGALTLTSTYLLLSLKIIAKNYIYKCKLREKIPNIIELKYRIKNYYSLEQYIAIKNNNLRVWNILDPSEACISWLLTTVLIGTRVYYVIYVDVVFYLYQIRVSY